MYLSSFRVKTFGNFIWICLLAVFKFSYSSGVEDQTVLSVVGIKNRHPTSFLNDYMVDNSVQPHFLFEFLTTLFAENRSTLSYFYFFFWLMQNLIFVLAINKIVASIYRDSFWITFAIIFVHVFSPYTLVGTTSTILGEALPHCLAGNLVLLTLGYLLAGSYKRALFVSMLVPLIHVQHGMTVAVLFLIFLLINLKNRHHLVTLFAAFLTNIFSVITYIQLRSFLGNLGDFKRVCTDLIPMHCDANAWPATWFVRFAAGISVTLAYLWLFKRDSSTKNFRIVITGFQLICISSVLMDYLDLPVLGSVVQATNAYRFGVLLINLIPVCLVITLAQIARAQTDGFWVRFGLIPTVFVSGGLYVFTTLSVNRLLLGLFYFSTLMILSYIHKKSLLKGLLVVVCIVLVSTSFLGMQRSNFSKSNLLFGSPYYESFRSLKRMIPVGSTVLVDPLGGQYFRLATSRAIFVDCKYKPYGGEPLNEYLRRMNLFGGFYSVCGNYGYKSMNSESIINIALKERIDFVLLEKSAVPSRSFRDFSILSETSKFILLKKDFN